MSPLSLSLSLITSLALGEASCCANEDDNTAYGKANCQEELRPPTNSHGRELWNESSSPS